TRFSRDWSSDVCSSDLRKSLSWETKINVPSKANKASFKTSLDFRSKWFVGSSRISRLTGSKSNFTMANLVFSPPDKTLTFLSISSPPNIKRPKIFLICVLHLLLQLHLPFEKQLSFRPVKTLGFGQNIPLSHYVPNCIFLENQFLP